MSAHTWWVAAWVSTAALIAAVPVLLVAGIWEGSWRIAGMGLVLSPFAIGAGTVMEIWSSGDRPERPLPRRDRKRLREEESRIRVAAEIKRMEQEAGL